MTTRIQLTTTLLLTAYLLTVILTDFSLTGYWTDIFFSVLILIIGLRIVFVRKTEKRWLTFILRSITLSFSVLIFGLIGLSLINPFAWEIFQMRPFKQEVDDREFQAYFKPVGAYGRGYGSFLITESPKYFPIIEWAVYRDNATDNNFNIDTLGGQPVKEIILNIIKQDVLKRK